MFNTCFGFLFQIFYDTTLGSRDRGRGPLRVTEEKEKKDWSWSILVVGFQTEYGILILYAILNIDILATGRGPAYSMGVNE